MVAPSRTPDMTTEKNGVELRGRFKVLCRRPMQKREKVEGCALNSIKSPLGGLLSMNRSNLPSSVRGFSSPVIVFGTLCEYPSKLDVHDRYSTYPFNFLQTPAPQELGASALEGYLVVCSKRTCTLWMLVNYLHVKAISDIRNYCVPTEQSQVKEDS